MFPESERMVFKYFDGEKERYGDPLAIRRRMILACKGKYNVLWEQFFADLSREGMSEERKISLLLAAAAAGEDFVPAVRQAFEMVPWNPETGEGATEAHCERAARAWADWCEDAQKKTTNSHANSPTSSSPAVASPTPSATTNTAG
jgi:hypothetical protein